MLPSGRIVWTSSFSCFCHKLSLGTKRKRAARSVNPSKTLIFPEASHVFSTWAASALHWQRMFGVNFKRKLQAVESHCIMSAKCLSGTRRLQMSIDPPGLQQHETKTHPPSRRVPLFSLSLSLPLSLFLFKSMLPAFGPERRVVAAPKPQQNKCTISSHVVARSNRTGTAFKGNCDFNSRSNKKTAALQCQPKNLKKEQTARSPVIECVTI